MKSRSRLLPWMLLIIAVLSLAFVVLRLANRVAWKVLYPSDGDEISSKGRIGVTFNQPMQAKSVEQRFSIQPEVSGNFSWEGNTLWFSPEAWLDPAQIYQVKITAGAEAFNGRALSKPLTWQVLVREPDILYLVLNETGGELWRYEFSSGSTNPITETNDSVIDFAPSPTGDTIAFAQNNNSGGTDLWITNRDGSDPVKLLDCSYDRCSQTAWSVDGAWIAYARESFDHNTVLFQPARVWIVNALSGETNPLYQQDRVYGHSPSFSPDGKRLATYDSLQNAIRILELETSQESAVPTVYPSVGDWSPKGDELIFVNLVPGVLEPNVGMFIVNFDQQEIRDAFGEFLPNMDYDPPRWSPDGQWIAYGLRPVGGGISKGIWIHNLDTGETKQLTDDPAATFSGYRWDPWGERLVFQRFQLSGGSTNASLWLWDRATNTIQMLVENGARPEWLP